jgi:hypothetical protein
MSTFVLEQFEKTTEQPVEKSVIQWRRPYGVTFMQSWAVRDREAYCSPEAYQFINEMFDSLKKLEDVRDAYRAHRADQGDAKHMRTLIDALESITGDA